MPSLLTSVRPSPLFSLPPAPSACSLLSAQQAPLATLCQSFLASRDSSDARHRARLDHEAMMVFDIILEVITSVYMLEPFRPSEVCCVCVCAANVTCYQAKYTNRHRLKSQRESQTKRAPDLRQPSSFFSFFFPLFVTFRFVSGLCGRVRAVWRVVSW